MELTSDILTEIEVRILTDWRGDRGCQFAVNDGNGIAWDITVYSDHKWDCWATKRGTMGKTQKTFARFDIRRAKARLAMLLPWCCPLVAVAIAAKLSIST